MCKLHPRLRVSYNIVSIPCRSTFHISPVHSKCCYIPHRQVQERKFNDAQISLSTSFSILNSLQIIWPSVQWNDLRKPLFSALAARLILDNTGVPIPRISDIDGQADYWLMYYHTGTRTKQDFIDAVAECEQSVGKLKKLYVIIISSSHLYIVPITNLRN